MYNINCFKFCRSDKHENKRRKKRKIEDDHTLEELYENKVSKIMEETTRKSVRMMLPIKTQNGLVEKRVLEEDNEIINEEEDQITNDNQKENEENNQQENSDIEIDIDTYVRTKKTLIQKNIYLTNLPHKIHILLLLKICRITCKKLINQYLLLIFWHVVKNY